jgi:hypothetical protein
MVEAMQSTGALLQAFEMKRRKIETSTAMMNG